MTMMNLPPLVPTLPSPTALPQGVPTSRGFNPCCTEAKTEYGPPPEVPPAPDGPSIGDQLRAKYKDHVPSPTVIPHIVTR